MDRAIFSIPSGRTFRPKAFHNELYRRIQEISSYLKDTKARTWDDKIFIQFSWWVGNRSFGSHKTTGEAIALHQEYNGSHSRSTTLTFLTKDDEIVWKKQLGELFFHQIEKTLGLLTQSTEEIYVIHKFKATRVDTGTGRFSPIFQP
jgi:hypothetical protein